MTNWGYLKNNFFIGLDTEDNFKGMIQCSSNQRFISGSPFEFEESLSFSKINPKLKKFNIQKGPLRPANIMKMKILKRENITLFCFFPFLTHDSIF